MGNWEKNLRKIEPYVPGEQPKLSKMIKLNTNENPYPPAKGVKAVMENLDMSKMRLYPDPKIEKLVNAIADNLGVSNDMVFVGVGSDDVLATAFMTYFNSDKPILFADITYSFYDVWASLFKTPYKLVPLDENFRSVKENYYQENGGVIFANPNAPTGVFESLDFVEDIVKHNQDSIVIIDEAYVDFGGESAISLLDKYENLVVVQTFSKSRSMAGMRIGYAVASPRLIRAMNDVKYSYNSYTLNYCAIEAGTAAILDREYFNETCSKIVATREKYIVELEKLGFTILPSKANFVFASHKSVPAKEIFEKLKEKAIFVRYFNKPRIDNYLRITIGTDEEMNELIDALKEIV